MSVVRFRPWAPVTRSRGNDVSESLPSAVSALVDTPGVVRVVPSHGLIVTNDPAGAVEPP